MSKVTFRAKALDHSRPMPIYIGEAIQKIKDFVIANRTVPEISSGMEKEEERQQHLQRALTCQQMEGCVDRSPIPIPHVQLVIDEYQKIYNSKKNFIPPKKYIYVQPSLIDSDLPDYDLDSDDECWLQNNQPQLKELLLDPLRAERMLDIFEKASANKLVSLAEGKLLTSEKSDLVELVYEHWKEKKLKQQAKSSTKQAHKLSNSHTTPSNNSSINPYIVFRRRAEKMQTRKNRKIEELSYQKMLLLKIHLKKALNLLEMLKKREALKKDLLKQKSDIIQARYDNSDWLGLETRKCEASLPPMMLSSLHSFNTTPHNTDIFNDDNYNHTFKRDIYTKHDYKKVDHVRKDKYNAPKTRNMNIIKNKLTQKLKNISNQDDSSNDDEYIDYQYNNKVDIEMLTKSHSLFLPNDFYQQQSDDDNDNEMITDDDDDEDEDDENIERGSKGEYSFKRNAKCQYHNLSTMGSGISRFPVSQYYMYMKCPKFLERSLAHFQRSSLIGRLRGRIGRGGRVNLDRSALHMTHSLSYKFNKDAQKSDQPHKDINIMDDDDDDDDDKSDNDFWNLESHDFDDKKFFNPVKNSQNDSKHDKNNYNNNNNVNNNFLVTSRKSLSKCRSYSSDSGVSSPFTVKSSSSPPPPISSSPPTSLPLPPHLLHSSNVESEVKHYNHSMFPSPINDKIRIEGPLKPSGDDVVMNVSVATPM